MPSTYVKERVEFVLSHGGISKQAAKLKKLGIEPDQWFAARRDVSQRLATLLDQNPVLCDCETTGIGDLDRVIQIAAIKVDGTPIGCDLVKTPRPVSPTSATIHGYTTEHVNTHGLEWRDVWPKYRQAFRQASHFVGYNAGFDHAKISQTCFADGIKIETGDLPPLLEYDIDLECALWLGDWNPKRHTWKKAKLDAGHDALEDIKATLDLIQVIAKNPG